MKTRFELACMGRYLKVGSLKLSDEYHKDAVARAVLACDHETLKEFVRQKQAKDDTET